RELIREASVTERRPRVLAVASRVYKARPGVDRVLQIQRYLVSRMPETVVQNLRESPAAWLSPPKLICRPDDVHAVVSVDCRRGAIGCRAVPHLVERSRLRRRNAGCGGVRATTRRAQHGGIVERIVIATSG